jgi:hypothetical protein
MMGYPAALLPWTDYDTTWRMLKDSDVDIWPEVWLTEEGANCSRVM